MRTEKAEKQQEQIDGWDEEKRRLTKERNEFERKFKTLETEVGTLEESWHTQSQLLRK